MDYLEQNVERLITLCKSGAAGEYFLPIKQISFPITNRCNSHCIMCHACSKDYENHTYFNESPMEMTLKNITQLFPLPKRSFREKICRVKKHYNDEASFMFSSAESLLNSHLDIYAAIWIKRKTMN